MTHLYVLFEHAAGYSLFKSAVSEESTEVQKCVYDVESFKTIADMVNFQPFKTGRDALENMNCISEGLLPTTLEEFLENNVPKSKKKHPVVLGVSEPKLAAAISEKLGISCTASGVVPEIIRGVRFHFHNLVPGFSSLSDANKSQLGLGHHYSRARVKFNVNRIDNMIIQSISLLDQLDKDINTFTMRVREWYSHHFPELIKIVPDNAVFVQCLKVIRDRKAMPEDCAEQLEEILKDPVKVEKIIEVANNSMGMDISDMDLANVYSFAERIISLTQRRKELMEYLRSKMTSVAPNLAALIGEVVGARLIAHAGSLINLAKYPASTVQILGAEKALFRALKTRGNTPKYGIIFHSKFIGKAAKSNKGRISRYLANKCSVASRIDCFRDIPTDIFGQKLRQQVESRLKFYETGELPPKNLEVMDEALEEAEVAQVAILKQMKKEKKKAKKRLEESMNDSSHISELEFSVISNESMSAETPKGEESEKKKKKRKKLEAQEADNEAQMEESMEVETPKKKKKKSLSAIENLEEDGLQNGLENNQSDHSGKKKKKKRKSVEVNEI